MNPSTDLGTSDRPADLYDEVTLARVQRKLDALTRRQSHGEHGRAHQVRLLRELLLLVEDLELLCRSETDYGAESIELAVLFATAQNLGHEWASVMLCETARSYQNWSEALTGGATEAEPSGALEAGRVLPDLPAAAWAAIMSDAKREASSFATEIFGFWRDLEASFMTGFLTKARRDAETERLIATWEQWAKDDAKYDAERLASRKPHQHRPDRRRARFRPSE